MNYTKGPWKVDPLSHKYQQAVMTSDDGLVADCFENKANARLIAKAPDLYEWVRDFGLFVAVNYTEIDGELKPSYIIDEDYMEQRKKILAGVEK